MIEEAIIKTLSYRDLFDYPLTAEEIHRFLIQQNSSREMVEKTLKKMVAEGGIEEKEGYHFLPGRRGITQLRREREAISQEKFRRACRYAKLLRPIPWVRAIFVTGALAVGNADEESDLDLLIIATARRLWLTRFLVFLTLSLLGVRRRPQNMQAKNKVCDNIFLSEFALSIPSSEQNLYTAHETVQVKPIWEKDVFQQCFLAENSWVKRFLPNFNLPPKPSKLRSRRSLLLFDWLELLAYKLQLKYMEKKRTREVVTPERILFHPIDRAAGILPKFEERLKRFDKPL